jgi:hypothetical protein
LCPGRFPWRAGLGRGVLEIFLLAQCRALAALLLIVDLREGYGLLAYPYTSGCVYYARPVALSAPLYPILPHSAAPGAKAGPWHPACTGPGAPSLASADLSVLPLASVLASPAPISSSRPCSRSIRPALLPAILLRPPITLLVIDLRFTPFSVFPHRATAPSAYSTAVDFSTSSASAVTVLRASFSRYGAGAACTDAATFLHARLTALRLRLRRASAPTSRSSSPATLPRLFEHSFLFSRWAPGTPAAPCCCMNPLASRLVLV